MNTTYDFFSLTGAWVDSCDADQVAMLLPILQALSGAICPCSPSPKATCHSGFRLLAMPAGWAHEAATAQGWWWWWFPLVVTRHS